MISSFVNVSDVPGENLQIVTLQSRGLPRWSMTIADSHLVRQRRCSVSKC